MTAAPPAGVAPATGGPAAGAAAEPPTSRGRPGRTAARHPAVVAAAVLWPAVVAGVYYTPAARCAVGRGPCRALPESEAIGRALPYAGEAARAAAASVGSAALLVAAAVVLGAALCRAAGWRFASALEAFLFRAALGVGAFATAGLALAAAGAYRAPVLRAAVGLVLVGGAVAAVRWLGRRPAAGAPAPGGWRPRDRADWVWAGCAAAAALAGFAAALAPDVEYDAVWYHLYFPRLFLEHGRLVDLPAEYVSLYPMTWELWFGYGLAFTPGAATLLHTACLPLAGAAAFALARAAAPAASPWLAAALFVTVPTMIWEASTAYVDLAVALHTTLVLLALVRYGRTGARQWLLLAAVNLGVALASKHVTLVVVALVCPGLALCSWLRDRRVGRALGDATALGLVALAFALPWYVRTWLATGNPLFPELYGLFGGPPDRWNAASDAGLRRFFARFGYPRTLANQLLLPWHLTMHAARFGGTPGPALLALVPLALLGGLTRAGRWVLAFAACYVALWASPLATFQFRWVAPALPALAVVGAHGYARMTAALGAAAGRWRAAAASVAPLALGALLLLQTPAFTRLHVRDATAEDPWAGWLAHTLYQVPLRVVVGAESRDAYLARSVPTYRAWQWAARSLPPGARVLAWAGGDHFYSHNDRVWAFAARAHATAFAPAGEDSAALAGLRALGVTHLLVEERFLARNGMSDRRWDDYALTTARARAAWYDVVYRDDRCTVYAVRAAVLAPPAPTAPGAPRPARPT